METMLQDLVIVGGLTFSLAASLLIEELIFGQIVRVAFARRAPRANCETAFWARQELKGAPPCCC
jgi:hypothetical protein